MVVFSLKHLNNENYLDFIRTIKIFIDLYFFGNNYSLIKLKMLRRIAFLNTTVAIKPHCSLLFLTTKAWQPKYLHWTCWRWKTNNDDIY